MNEQLETEVHILIEALKILIPDNETFYDIIEDPEMSNEQVKILENAKEIIDECREEID